MANIILVAGKHSSEQEKYAATNLSAQYTTQGHEAIVLNGASIFLLIKLIFSDVDVIDFHDSRSSLLIPLVKFLKRKTTIVFSLHERAEFNPKNNFVKRSLIRVGTYIGVLHSHQTVTSQKNVQYFIYRRFSLLPNYIPQGVDIVPPSPKRNYASRFLLIGEQNDCSKILRTFKTNRQIKFMKADEKIFSFNNTANIEKIDAILILKHLYNPSVIRKLATYGLPIIAIEANEHREVLRQNAIFISDNAPRRVKEAITELRKKYRQYSREGTRERKLIDNLFSWEHVAKEYLRLYRHSQIIEVQLDSLVKKEALV